MSFHDCRLNTFGARSAVLSGAAVGSSGKTGSVGIPTRLTEALCGDGDKISHCVLREMAWALEFKFQLEHFLAL